MYYTKNSLNSNEVDRLTDKTLSSQWYFNPVLLPLYDFFVYRLVSQYIWGCSSDLLITRYSHYLSLNHLEVGVGTGYLIHNSNPKNINLDLMDLSLSCLEKSRKRLNRYSPSIIRHNLLEEPIEEDKRYDSIGINYVMHCVAGDYTIKGKVFNNIKMLLKDKGVVFGSTVLKTKESTKSANIFMSLLNRFGIFNNTDDKIDELKTALIQNFKYVKIDIKSSVALFVASDDKSRI